MPRQSLPYIKFDRPILIDTSEQLPYRFTNILANANKKNKPYQVELVPFNLKPLGDYSLLDMQRTFAVERKNPDDFISSMIPTASNKRRRINFEAEIGALNDQVYHPFVVVEEEWSALYDRIRLGSNVNPRSIIRTWMSWQFKYPQVHWCFCPGRRAAEVVTFRLMCFAVERAKGK